jgi:presenilin-like A22 family membrane protease
VSLFIGAGFIAQQVAVVENPADVANSFGLLAYMVAAAALMLVLLRIYRGKLLFQLLEYGLVAASATVFGAVFLPGYELHLAAVCVAARFLFPKLQSLLLLFSSITVGSVLGASLDFLPVAVFAALLSAYDYIAVFRTRHMVALAQGLAERQAAFSIKIGPAAAQKGGEKGEGKKAAAPAPRTCVELGLGDFLVGVMLSVSALRIGAFPSFGFALASVVGASAGLALMFTILDKRGGYFPAVPPITAGSLLCVAGYWCALSLLGMA